MRGRNYFSFMMNKFSLQKQNAVCSDLGGDILSIVSLKLAFYLSSKLEETYESLG